MSRSVVVTGAAGFIGSHLSAALLERGDRVIGLDNLNGFYDPTKKRENLALLAPHEGFSCREGDIRDRDAVRAVLDEAGEGTAIVHLAAMAGVRPSIESPAHYSDVNLTGTSILLEEAAARGLKRFVFASSSSVYGERTNAPFRETDPVDHPVSPYAATKKAGELLCHTFHHVHRMDVACLRFFTVYGPRQRPEMAIHKFARLLADGKPVPMFGDGSTARDYTFIDDVVDGTIRALDRLDGYRVYNLGGSRTTRLDRLVDLIAGALGVPAKIDRKPEQAGDVPLTSACVDRAREELGYEPQVPIEEGIRRFAAWFREADR